MRIKENHLRFIESVAKGETYYNSYVSICKKSIRKNAAEVQGSRLAKKYANEIESARKVNSEIAEAAKVKAITDNVTAQILSASQRMDYLTGVINGKKTIPKIIVVDGSSVEIQVQANHIERIKAIAELNKMDGSYAPAKINITDKTIHVIAPEGV